MNGRSLPWRDTKDPYAIWLSEIILQQTRINQGMTYWERFMKRWPTVDQLAKAEEDEVLRLWQGLGYYSRARNLHKAARQIVAMGHFPNLFEEIKQLKGVGDYTAAAIGSIAFDLPLAVVDGNVFRVLARYFGVETPINSTQGKKEFSELAQSLLPVQMASTYNQGMMDFGAIQCTPKSPKCPNCPLMETCVAFRTNKVSDLPVKVNTLKVRKRFLTYIYLNYKGSIAIHQRTADDIWKGLWEPFNASTEKENVRTETPHEIALMLGNPNYEPQLRLIAKDVKHVLTHRILLADFYLIETQEKPKLPSDYIWVEKDRISDYAIPRLIELLIAKIS